MEIREKKRCLSTKRTALLLAHYFLGFCFLYTLFASYKTYESDPTAKYLSPSTELGLYIWTIGFAILIAWPALKSSWKYFKEHLWLNIRSCIYLALLGYVSNSMFYWAANVLTNTNNSANQEFLMQSIAKYPSITIFSICIFGPILEEIIFRVGFYAWLQKRIGIWPAIFISSFLFGFIHVAKPVFAGNFLEVSYVVSYAVAGMVFAYGYEKSSSCITPILIHSIFNIIGLVLLFL